MSRVARLCFILVFVRCANSRAVQYYQYKWQYSTPRFGIMDIDLAIDLSQTYFIGSIGVCDIRILISISIDNQ